MASFSSFRSFYSYYLSEHQNKTCRLLHFIGSWCALACIGLAFAQSHYWWLIGALLSGYGFAWIGHFFFENNRPATFRYPFYSFIGDWVMFVHILIGKISIFR